MTALQRIKNIGLAGLVLLTSAGSAWAYDYDLVLGDADPMIDMPIYTDPPIHESQSYPVFNPRLIDVWKAGLNRPDADTRRRVAAAVNEAHNAGMEGLAAAFTERMTRELSKEEQHRLVRLAMARTLVTLDARSAASAMLARSKADGLEMARIVDAKLAEWDHTPARTMWLDRLANPDAPAQLRIIAAQSLSEVGEAAAVETLEPMVVSSRTPVQLRLAAAAALGKLAPKNTSNIAAELAGNDSMVDKLAAVAVLSNTDSKRAREVLVSLTDRDEDGAIVAAALHRINQIDPLLVKSDAARLAAHKDGSVRELVLPALAKNPSAESISSLEILLGDHLPDVRRAARDVLIEFANDKSLYDQVAAAAMRTIKNDAWRGQEQAALVLGKLDHEPAFDVLIERVRSPRMEVAVASATAVRWLAIESKLDVALKTAEAMQEESLALITELSKLSPETEEDPEPRRRGDDQPEPVVNPLRDPDVQIAERRRVDLINAQLFQLFGELKYAPAEPVMLKYVPKKITDSIRYGTESRTAAVWALGYIHEGNADAAVAKQLRSRMKDANIMDPEVEFVRRAAAIALARMGVQSVAGEMRSLFNLDGFDTIVGAGAIRGWSMLTGNEMPEDPPAPYEQTNWFIAPLERLDL